MAAPKAFISYSHDSDAHKGWALRLGGDLRVRGVDVVVDQWDLVPGQDVSLFMQNGISKADRVIMICSSAYVKKADAGKGGVGYERLIVTAEMVQSIDTTKFIPILRGSDPGKKIPLFLGPRLYIDFENDAEYDQRLTDLAREIHGAPAVSKPPLGPNPFSGTPTSSTPARTIGTTGALSPGDRFLDSDWFSTERDRAKGGIQKLKLCGSMEISAGILHQLSKSQMELLNAVRQSEIRTFGWPIGITLENREEYRPRPYGDGIRAEIAIDENGRTSYDYWTVRSNGDFYLLQSLFEDQRTTNRIFFDTRIVRVTEALMFIENLYSKLGAPPEARVGIRVRHSGLTGRILTSASPSRLVFERETKESESTSEITTVLGTMKESRTEDVRKILEPLFMLFDFAEFNPDVYEDIVRRFERGQV
jgi:TIR domain